MYFLHFRNYHHFRKRWGSSFEQTWIPFTEECFVPSLVEFGPVVLEKYLNFVNVFSLFSNYLPLEKGVTLLFEQIWIPLTQECFVPSLIEIFPVVLEKNLKVSKVYRRTDRQTTDNRRSEKLTWAFSSGELKI